MSLFAAQPAGPNTAEEASVSRELLKVEKQVQEIKENQKKVDAKNAEIAAELANLRIWINRR